MDARAVGRLLNFIYFNARVEAACRILVLIVAVESERHQDR
jgi:hypothetical protein